jgi:hypothetical protein
VYFYFQLTYSFILGSEFDIQTLKIATSPSLSNNDDNIDYFADMQPNIFATKLTDKTEYNMMQKSSVAEKFAVVTETKPVDNHHDQSNEQEVRLYY